MPVDSTVQRIKPDGTKDIIEFSYGENMEDWDDELEEEYDGEDPLEKLLNMFTEPKEKEEQ